MPSVPEEESRKGPAELGPRPSAPKASMFSVSELQEPSSANRAGNVIHSVDETLTLQRVNTGD